MKKPIALILTDTHLDDTNIELNKSIFSQAIDLAKQLGLDCIHHGGDLFHSRKAQTQENLVALNDIFNMIGKHKLILRAAVGNHDKTAYNSKDSFLVQAAYHPDAVIYDTYGAYDLDELGVIKLWYLSFFSDAEYLEHYERMVKHVVKHKRTKNVLLTHIGIEGAVMNNGTIVGTHIPTRIKPSLFSHFDKVLVGHYHDYQRIDNKITYIGASIQHNYGELTGKGATVLYDDLSTEIVPLKYPEYIKYEVDPKDLSKQDIEDLKKEKEESGNNIRIVLVGSEADVKAYDKRGLEKAGIAVERKQESLDREELESQVEAFTGKTLYEEFLSFCTKKSIQPEKGTEYLTKVL